VPIFVELFQEFRSERFQLARLSITNKWDDIDAVKGLAGLPDDVRLAVNTVNNYFGTLGSLIIQGILQESEAVIMVGYAADQLWKKLEPLIMAERISRGNDEFACFFEDFIYRVRLHWPPIKSYGIAVQRLKDLPTEGNPSQQGLPENRNSS
jgi:hypothetical protein